MGTWQKINYAATKTWMLMASIRVTHAYLMGIPLEIQPLRLCGGYISLFQQGILMISHSLPTGQYGDSEGLWTLEPHNYLHPVNVRERDKDKGLTEGWLKDKAFAQSLFEHRWYHIIWEKRPQWGVRPSVNSFLFYLSLLVWLHTKCWS